MDSIQTSRTHDGQPYFAGRHCNPCPVCICPCWPRWNSSIGADDDQCDCWLGTCFCGNLFEASLCVCLENSSLGYPHELYRDSTCCSVVSSLTHPEYNDEEFAASHCFCCREDDEDDACYCHPYTNYKGKEQLAYCSFFSYESPEYKQYRADWQEWWKSQGRNAGARRPMRMIRWLVLNVLYAWLNYMKYYHRRLQWLLREEYQLLLIIPFHVHYPGYHYYNHLNEQYSTNLQN